MQKILFLVFLFTILGLALSKDTSIVEEVAKQDDVSVE